MYRKVHRNLTSLFTGITALILVVMSVSYLYMSEKTLTNNNFLSFSGEMNTLISNFEQQNTITYEWLSKVSAGGRYVLALYDNGTPLDYTANILTDEERSLVREIMENRSDIISSVQPDTAYTSSHKEFTYLTDEGEHYYVSYANIRHNPGSLTAMILYSAEPVFHQLFLQRIRFLLIDLGAILILFLFCWHFTKRLLSPIQKAQEQQAAFIAAASHELRTPVSVILSSVSAWKCAPPSEQTHFLNTVENEGQRLSRLITDMLTLARSDSHIWSFSLKKHEMDTLLLNVYEAFKPMADEKQIALSVELPEQVLPPCQCDGERISQVLGILITNALGYGRAGGFVKLSLQCQNNTFSLTVSDNGPGITDDAKQHIFDRFYRGDVSRTQKEHFGLGLCIAREIVTAHHGSILVGDTPGGGATFTVFLKR